MIRKSFTYEGQRYFIRAKDEKDFEVKKALKIRDINENVLIIRKNITCSQWAKEWPETFRPAINGKWNKNIHCILNSFCNMYGNFPLNKIAQKNVQIWANSLSGLSQITYNKYLAVVKSFFETAADNDLIRANPVKNIKRPMVSEHISRRSISDSERRIILEVSEYHPLGMYLKMMLFCGLRTMEVAALEGRDIDLKNNLVYVRSNIDYNGNKKAPKTSAGVRKVPIVDVYAKELRKLDLKPFEPVFTTPRGKRFTNSTFQKSWKSFKKSMEEEHPFSVSPDLVPYCLRHTFCTDLQDAGVPINVAKVLMGHSSIKVTAQIYTHHTEKSMESAREKMNDYASGPCHDSAINL